MLSSTSPLEKRQVDALGDEDGKIPKQESISWPPIPSTFNPIPSTKSPHDSPTKHPSMGVAGELLKAMTPPPSNPLRTYVLTGAVAAITATGAWYGAGLKYRREYTQERSAILEATPTERIEHMEAAKARLLAQKAELQTKIDRLEAKTAGIAAASTGVTGSPP